MWKDGRTDMMLKVAFCNFVNVPEKKETCILIDVVIPLPADRIVTQKEAEKLKCERLCVEIQ
jgi:hypothetical protein